MLKKIKLGLRSLDICQKIQTTRNIISCIENNSRFPESDPQLSDITEAVNKLEYKFSDILKEREVIQLKTMELNELENDLDKKITLLAAYVESKAKGDIEAIHSAGMDVRADAVPVGIPARVIIKSIRETLNFGELKIKWEKVRGAKVYNVELRDIRDTNWKLYDSTTKIKILVTHLKSETKYWFRVQAIGSAGKGAYSDPVVKFAP